MTEQQQENSSKQYVRTHIVAKIFMKFIENVMKLQPENKTESNECQNPEW